MTRILLAVGVLLGASLPATAQDVDSGPKKGEKAPALKVYDATGENKEKTVDYVGLRKDKPTVYLFVGAGDDARGKLDRPMFRFIKGLDGVIEKDLEDAYAVVVFLTEDEDKTKDYLPLAQKSGQFEKTALASFKSRTGRRTGASTPTRT